MWLELAFLEISRKRLQAKERGNANSALGHHGTTSAATGVSPASLK